MKYTFKDINTEDIYNNSLVLIILGKYQLFNNIAIDKMKSMCKTSNSYVNSDILADFDISNLNSAIDTISNVDFNTFEKNINTVSLTGSWLCITDYSYISEKQKKWFLEYIKNPSNNGRLVLYTSDYKKYGEILKNKVILNSSNVNVLTIGYVNKFTLKKIVLELLNERGAYTDSKGLDLFISRMGTTYDDYIENIDKIVDETIPMGYDYKSNYYITYNNILEALKGTENFVFDSFINKLTVYIKNDSKRSRTKILTMFKSLEEEYGTRPLMGRLKNKVYDYITFRVYINIGKIPVIVNFSVPEAKENIGNSRICKYSDYTFREMAITASKMSLRDWEIVYLMICNIIDNRDNFSYERAAYALINRHLLNRNRLLIDSGLKDYKNPVIERINSIDYVDKN